MRNFLIRAACLLALAATSSAAFAAPALQVLGRDFAFPHQVEGLPAKLSDFKDLQINTFTTGDGVKLTYWEAGKGRPLIFVPGWSANGAEYVNVMYLESRRHPVDRSVTAEASTGNARTPLWGGRRTLSAPGVWLPPVTTMRARRYAYASRAIPIPARMPLAERNRRAANGCSVLEEAE